jgi:hypothetical protein
VSQPIPRRMLPHVITVEPYLKTNGSTSVYGPGVTLKFVRVEPVRQSAQKSLGDMKNDRFKIFVDRVNSVPQAYETKAKDRVTYAGTQVIVRAVEPLTGDGPLVHHWEVYCGV